MFPCYLVILESQPSLNNEGVDASSSSLTSCRNKEPGCVGSPARESAGGTTWAFVSMLLLVDLAFRVVVMLRGRSPNLQDQMKSVSGMNRKRRGPAKAP